jgi:hypothetical protein
VAAEEVALCYVSIRKLQPIAVLAPLPLGYLTPTPSPLEVHTRCNRHRHELLEQQLARVGDGDLRDFGLVLAPGNAPQTCLSTSKDLGDSHIRRQTSLSNQSDHQLALSVTQRALSVTQRALSVTQRELSASPSELLVSPSEL